MHSRLEAQFAAHAALIEEVRAHCGPLIESVGLTLAKALQNGGKLLVFGNGGSAADAQHMAAEFVHRFQLKRPPLPALALTTDSSVLTAIANDEDFSNVFAKQVQALGAPGDVAVGLSTTGASANVLAAFRTAREQGLTTVALLGRDGGDAQVLADFAVVVGGDDTARIQEAHLLIEHMLCDFVEYALFLNPSMIAPSA